MEDNHDFTLNANNLINRLIRSRWLFSLIVALLLLSAHWANADPVGDFFKKVGQSISKAFQPQPSPGPTRKKQASGRLTSRESNAAATEASPLEEPPKSVKEEKPAPTVLPASAAPPAKAKGDM